MKEVPGYPNYFATKDGRIWSSKSNRFLKYSIKRGYPVVNISKRGTNKKFNVLIHRMIALAFIPNPENKYTVNHKNGIRNDNRVENLEWATPSENILHKYRTLKYSAFGDNSPFHKLNSFDVQMIHLALVNGFTCRDIAKAFKVTNWTIHNIKQGRAWAKLTGISNAKRNPIQTKSN